MVFQYGRYLVIKKFVLILVKETLHGSEDKNNQRKLITCKRLNVQL